MKKLGCFIVIGLIGIGILMPVFILTVFTNNSPSGGEFNTNVWCSPAEVNQELWDAAFSRAGVFNGKDQLILESADYWNVDPVLYAAIAFHETGWGSSRAVILYNNPGGLMGTNGLMRFETLADGLVVMGRTLNNIINVGGNHTLEAIRDVYAPLGADNDPNGMNHHWVPTITSIINQLGGLTQNCERPIEEFGMPLDPPIVVTSHFGMRRDPFGNGYQFHNGIDFGGAHIAGQPIRASLEGIVVRVQHSNEGYGNMVILQHHNGYWTLYAHLQAIHVVVDDVVAQGEQIGTVGSTGNSTGPHLHMEIRTMLDGGQVDPAPRLGIER